MTELKNACTLCQWDNSLPDTFALEQVISNAIDMTISVSGAHTPHGPGMVHEVVSPAEHLILFNVPSAPLVRPAEFGGTAANMRNQQRAHDEFDRQLNLNPVVRSAVVTVLPDRILRLAEVNG